MQTFFDHTTHTTEFLGFTGNTTDIKRIRSAVFLGDRDDSIADTLFYCTNIYSGNTADTAFHSWHRQIYIQAGRTPTDDSGKFVLTGNAAKFRKDHGSIATHMSGDRAGNRTFLNLSLIILCNDTLYILAVIVKISYNSQIFNGSVILGDKRFFQSVNSV